MERQLRVSFLGLIPTIKPEQREDIDDATPLRDNFLIMHPKSSVAECCRTVRTNILFMSPENPPKRILVTSAGPQEGKSTVVINLGITMAQSGSRVLLVDTDMRRPRLHKSFGLGKSEGISSVILGEVELQQAVIKTEVDNLEILPCGPIPPNPTELFHTDRFANLVETLTASYDRLIFDSPPVMMVADPLILSHSMDGVIMVVKGASTSRDVVRRALRQLEDVKARVLGVVINDLDLDNKQYGYYYYRRYGYYYGEKESDVSSTG